MKQHHIPLIIRGRVIKDPDVEFGGRSGTVSFTTPDVKKYIEELSLGSPSALSDLYTLTFDEILEYLEALGSALNLKTNGYMQEACELSHQASGLTRGIVDNFYGSVGQLFQPAHIREVTESAIGVEYLESWVERRMASGCLAQIRAFGARTVHVLSGNVPLPSVNGVINNAITRSDAVFKTPSNDPMTAAAIASTMVDMAPDHPLTHHLTVAYWKGGDAGVEDILYRPDHIEKIIAWGGHASIRHISRYIQPGIDLITMDPKLSSSIVGEEAFATDENMLEAAERLAIDIGYFNQQGCVNARVIYIQTGTDEGGLSVANRFGRMTYEAVQALPSSASGAAERMEPALADELLSLKIMGEGYKVFGGGLDGAVIVSQQNEPVDFSALLNDRVANLVPVDDFEIPIRSVTSSTQTIGIYPDSLKAKIRDRLIFNGAQRLTSLGYACKPARAGPADGMEPLRRMVKWITDETNDPAVVPLLSRI